MLVVGRKLNESIILEAEDGTIIEVKITEIGKQIRLGIEAPNSMRIWRKELYQTILENRKAAEVAAVSAPQVSDLLSLAKTIKMPSVGGDDKSK